MKQADVHQQSSEHSTSRPFFSKASGGRETAAFFSGVYSGGVQCQAETSPLPEEEEQTLQQKPLDGAVKSVGAETEPADAGRFIVQPQLTIGQAGDPYEQEADHVADQLVGHMQASKATSTQTNAEPHRPNITPFIQRQGEGSAAVAPQLEHGIKQSRSSGEAIAPSVRGSMERAMGADFSGVRVHANSEADTLNRSLNARAFTTGQDIYFKSGEYQPESPAGQRLLAHELTHVVQQGGAANLIQADFAIAPTAPGTQVQTLTQTQIQAAISFNQGIYTNATQIGFLRDVLGISSTPAVIDADFVNAVVRYQAQYGLTQDGQLDLATANRLAREITAESDYLRGSSQQSIVTRGTVAHSGSVGAPPAGAQGPPVGAVEVRTGEEITLTPGNNIPNVIALEYTGALSGDSRWLQFVWFELTAVTPQGTASVSGSVPTSSGVLPFTTNSASPNWAVDAGTSANNPFYEASAAMLRNSSSTTMFDAPGGGTVAPLAQAVLGAGVGATSVTFTAHFSAYLIQNNQAVYVVPYNASTTFTPPAVAGGALTVGAISYAVGNAAPATALPANLRTVLHNSFPIFRNIQ
ncbi:MAG: DUF4157 domain-containing protein [Pseudomonadota bacterium]|mgnify:CR=1 FL=1